MTGMKVRPLTEADAAAFQALRLEGLQDTPTAFSSSYEEEVDRPLDVVAERLAPTDDRVVFGAFEGDALQGVLGLLRMHHLKERHKAVIWGMYVTPAARGHGLARTLMDTALARARAMPGLRQVLLGVEAGNRSALALYATCGFRPYGTEPKALVVDGVARDELFMVHFLDEALQALDAAPTA